MKKILVISNGSFSNIDSNGRTLAKLFNGYDPSCLAQFCTYGTPDFNVCDNFYKVTDSDALKSFVKRKPFGGCVVESDVNSTEGGAEVPAKKISKTPLKILLREIVWKYGAWYGEALRCWIENFAPDELLVFAGDNSFLLRLTEKISLRYNIPVTIYTTEDYYFKDYNFFNRRKSLIFKFLRKNLVKAYNDLAKVVHRGLFNTPKLTEMYKKEFSFDCRCLYAKSDIDFIDNSAVKRSDVRVSYLGNLGLERHVPLLEIADTLSSIIPGAKLSVYGRADDRVTNQLKSNPNIELNGFVGYNEVVEIIHKSNLIVHAEKNDEMNNKDLQAAFSTKIADSVCSGTPFFMYANKELAGTDFLMNNNCAFVACDSSELEPVLRDALMDENKRKTIVNNACKTREACFMSGDSMVNIFNE